MLKQFEHPFFPKFFMHFYAPPQKVTRVLCYTVLNFECWSVSASIICVCSITLVPSKIFSPNFTQM